MGRDRFAVGEMGCVELALNALQLRPRNSISETDVQMLQVNRENADACAQSIEIGLERLLRQLVRVRVKLLNILTDH